VSDPIRIFFRKRKPAQRLPATTERTSLRVSHQSADALQTIRATLVEWHLTSADPQLRREALHLSTDAALRIVLATFARDYHIALATGPKE
jgi:hypothetical protein